MSSKKGIDYAICLLLSEGHRFEEIQRYGYGFAKTAMHVYFDKFKYASLAIANGIGLIFADPGERERYLNG